jgi:hypothetical protein
VELHLDFGNYNNIYNTLTLVYGQHLAALLNILSLLVEVLVLLEILVILETAAVALVVI